MAIRKKKRLAHPKKMRGLMAEKASVLKVKARRTARQKPHGGYPTKRTMGVKMQAIKAANQKRRRRRATAPSVRK